jgi:YcxB-like protein
MKPKEITLNFNKADFEELCFKDNGSRILLSKPVKEQFILSVIAGLFVIASLILSILTYQSWWIFTIITVLFMLIMNQLFKKMEPIKRWKKSIKEFINEQTKFISQKLILSDDTLTIKRDSTITVIRWKAFNKVTIDPKSINLYADDHFMIPKKSMTSAEFDLLRDEILAKVKS